MVKLQLKSSGSFRTVAGTERFARMRVLLETARKQGKPKKVAFVASICRLLLILNAVSREQVPWQKDPVSTTIKSLV